MNDEKLLSVQIEKDSPKEKARAQVRRPSPSEVLTSVVVLEVAVSLSKYTSTFNILRVVRDLLVVDAARWLGHDMKPGGVEGGSSEVKERERRSEKLILFWSM